MIQLNSFFVGEAHAQEPSPTPATSPNPTPELPTTTVPEDDMYPPTKPTVGYTPPPTLSATNCQSPPPPRSE